ncbi:MAG: N-formylglutamate amidohydrolase [Myxococcales bacterium]|nr:N-formylglutamate amidohydrolase [Myxococcales bacterium]
MAVERIGGQVDAPVVLTCEHASNVLPDPWRWPEADRWIVETHWAFDLGAAEIVRALAEQAHLPSVLAGFSRLLVDPNRPVGHAELFRGRADGREIHLNKALHPDEQRRRIEVFHRRYHDAVDAMLQQHHRARVLSVHSFTPVYQGGPPRPMEIGVLFDLDDALARAAAEILDADGWVVALNEPYSGRDGLIYSAHRHATRHRRQALELEIRQDVAVDPERRERVVASLRKLIPLMSR